MSTEKVEKRNAQVKLVFGKVVEPEFNLDRMMEELGLEFHAFATSAGVLIMKMLMEAEELNLAGARQSHGTEINRWGKQKGSVVVGGQKVRLDRKRLRTREGNEMRLKSYERFHTLEDRARAVYQRLICGMSSRNYEQSVEAVSEGYGVSKSVVNREMIQSTAKHLSEFCERDLSVYDIWVLMIDGIKVGQTMEIVALGIDFTGQKRFLGFREGSTENAQVCIDLFHDLIARKLSITHPMIVVIDGSKALRSAVDQFFGEKAQVQRCQQHKRENVKKYLPDEYHAQYDRKIKAAYAMNEYEDAKKALSVVIKDLQRINITASGSLEEGFEETLTLHRLGIPSILRKSFSTTNLIESPFSHVRTVMRNVKRWRKGTSQTLRWTATALLEAEKRFRRVKGYKSMSVLKSNLEATVVAMKHFQEQIAA